MSPESRFKRSLQLPSKELLLTHHVCARALESNLKKKPRGLAGASVSVFDVVEVFASVVLDSVFVEVLGAFPNAASVNEKVVVDSLSVACADVELVGHGLAVVNVVRAEETFARAHVLFNFFADVLRDENNFLHG